MHIVFFDETVTVTYGPAAVLNTSLLCFKIVCQNGQFLWSINIRIELYFFVSNSVVKDKIHVWIFEKRFTHYDTWPSVCHNTMRNNLGIEQSPTRTVLGEKLVAYSGIEPTAFRPVFRSKTLRSPYWAIWQDASNWIWIYIKL